MLSGFLFGLAATMIWGLVYLIPLVLPGYDPMMISSARYVAFGLACIPLVWLEREEFRHYSLSDWWFVTKLSVVGNIIYFWLLSVCIQRAGAPFAGICMAVIPVLVAAIANIRDRRKGRQALRWSKLLPGLALIAAGLVFSNWAEFDAIVNISGGSESDFWIGSAAGVAALLLWTWYPIRNADWLIENPQRSPKSWSTAQGITGLPVSLILFAAVYAEQPAGTPLLGPTPVWFVTVMTGCALLCSWVGILCWNAMSQRLPTALSGQMIVFETIFAVTYAHILRCEIPSPMLSLGVVSLIAGVLVSLRAFQRFGHSEPV
ncbi:MAG TPA: EamA/RhaT family transporter [Sutterella sp.]|nr:EamA/RhaT family transporter [Sutterella sp.]